MKRVVCDECKTVIEYEDKSMWEGNREFEDVNCPVCGNHLDRIFTDLVPNPRVVIKDGDYSGTGNNH